MSQFKKPKRLVVPYDDAVSLLKQAGYKAKWTKDKVQLLFDKLPDKVREDDLDDEDLKELYFDVCDALSANVPVLVEGQERVEPGPKPEPAKVEKVKKGRPKKEKPEPDAKKGRPGICRACLEFMEAASEREPITVKQIWEKLIERFPDRDRSSLKSTADRAPYWADDFYKVRVHKNPRGYWITRNYQGPFKRIPSGRRVESEGNKE